MKIFPIKIATFKYKLRWHVLLVHFPISFFLSAFMFQILHLFIAPACLELGTNILLIAGTLMMIPVTWSGWSSWKKNYNGLMGGVFEYKIIIAFFMLVFSFILVIWRIAFFESFLNDPQDYRHWIYLAGNSLLILGAVAEGYYGGHLNHR